MSFIEELKRRNVIRVGIAYAISSWVILQIADLVLENTEAPGWVMDVLMFFVALGFLISLVVAWAFELTPEGVKREKDVDRSESITQQTGRKLEWITLGAAAVVVVLFLADRFVLDQPSPVPATSQTVETDSAVGQGADASEPADTAQADESAEIALGVAVLPFENLSTDQANAFFAGGVHEDVLSHLSRIHGLRIISRTSMLRIAERNLAIPEIGAALGVSHVLEGSVRRAGDQVRVTVQLIDVATDQHLWAENYDRQLDDIFAIQSEIASAIADQLQTELSPSERSTIEAAPTSNMLAYDYYLKARDADRIWRASEGFQDQRDLLEQAIAIDPEFLDAKVMLANAYGRLVWTGVDSEGIYRKKARELTESIQAEFPDTYQAAVARANYRYTVMRDYDQTVRDYAALVELEPNDLDMLLALSSSYKRMDRYEEGLAVVDRAVKLDPESSTLVAERSFHLLGLGRVDDALEELSTGLERFPENESIRSTLARIMLVSNGDLNAYRELTPDRFGSPESLNADRIGQFSGLEQRLGLEEFGLDAALKVLKQSRVEADPWQNALVDVEEAVLLNLAGREESARNKAALSLQYFEDRLAQGLPFPTNLYQNHLATFAYVACLADDIETANLLTGIAKALPVEDVSMKDMTDLQLALAQAECGNIDAAWAQVKALDRRYYGESEWFIIIDPIFAHYFRALPDYQELLERMTGGDA